MIITCPDCETQYLVKPADIAPDGRDVKCSRCDYSWYVAPMVEDGGSAGIPPMTPVAAAPAGADAAKDEAAPIDQPAADSEAAETTQQNPHDTYYDHQLPVPVEQKGPGLRFITALVLLLCFIGAGLGLMRQQAEIITYWPAAVHIYERLGLAPSQVAEPVKPPLELRDVRISDAATAQGTVLVSGLVYGPRVPAMAALIDITIEDADGRLLAQYILDRKSFSDAADGVRFAYELQQDIDGAHGVIVTLK